MTPTFSVILPTIGRPMLGNALRSCLEQPSIKGDEVIVCVDGFERGDAADKGYDAAFDGTPMMNPLVVHLCVFPKWHAPNPKSVRHFAPRNQGMVLAAGSHLLFLDDDDAFLPDVWGQMREAIAENHPRMHVFRIGLKDKPESVIWKKKRIDHPDFQTGMGVIPNLGKKLPRWRPKSKDDISFFTACRAVLGEPVWHRLQTQVVRPEGTVSPYG